MWFEMDEQNHELLVPDNFRLTPACLHLSYEPLNTKVRFFSGTTVGSDFCSPRQCRHARNIQKGLYNRVWRSCRSLFALAVCPLIWRRCDDFVHSLLSSPNSTTSVMQWVTNCEANVCPHLTSHNSTTAALDRKIKVWSNSMSASQFNCLHRSSHPEHFVRNRGLPLILLSDWTTDHNLLPLIGQTWLTNNWDKI